MLQPMLNRLLTGAQSYLERWTNGINQSNRQSSKVFAHQYESALLITTVLSGAAAFTSKDRQRSPKYLKGGNILNKRECDFVQVVFLFYAKCKAPEALNKRSHNTYLTSILDNSSTLGVPSKIVLKPCNLA